MILSFRMRRSSMVELPAVNGKVPGSSPGGAAFKEKLWI